MTAGNPARNRRSAEQMLVDLKGLLREISDLNAAGDVLNWDQATYMPEGGASARGRQRAMLYRLAHERAVAPALGTLIDALTHHGESLPYDSDDASLIRVARREYQKKIKIPPDHVERATAHSSASYNAWTRARPTNDFATMVPSADAVVKSNAHSDVRSGGPDVDPIRTLDPHSNIDSVVALASEAIRYADQKK
jgi:carboxypeptidase Taq